MTGPSRIGLSRIELAHVEWAHVDRAPGPHLFGAPHHTPSGPHLLGPPSAPSAHSPSPFSPPPSPHNCNYLGPPGFHTTAREPKRAHFRVPAFKNTTKIQREDLPREGRKKENCCGGRGKQKREILGGPAEGVRRRGGLGEGGPGEGGFSLQSFERHH